jgi:hypothetical protein
VKLPPRLLVIFLIALLGAASLATAQPVALTILHSNDTHGHLLPFSYPDSAASGTGLQGLRVYKDIGGIARRTTLAKRIRQELDQRRTPVWFVDLGDYSDGTPFSSEYHGEADVAAMNAAGYDMGTFGNHEFNNTAAQLRKLVGATKYQLLCANATDRASGKPLVPPYVVKTLGSLRIGVFGLLTHESATYPAGKEAITPASNSTSGWPSRSQTSTSSSAAIRTRGCRRGNSSGTRRISSRGRSTEPSSCKRTSGAANWAGSTSCSTRTKRASGTWNAIEPG